MSPKGKDQVVSSSTGQFPNRAKEHWNCLNERLRREVRGAVEDVK